MRAMPSDPGSPGHFLKDTIATEETGLLLFERAIRTFPGNGLQAAGGRQSQNRHCVCESAALDSILQALCHFPHWPFGSKCANLSREGGIHRSSIYARYSQ